MPGNVRGLVAHARSTSETNQPSATLDRDLIDGPVAPWQGSHFIPRRIVEGNFAIDGEPISRIHRGVYGHAHTFGGSHES